MYYIKKEKGLYAVTIIYEVLNKILYIYIYKRIFINSYKYPEFDNLKRNFFKKKVKNP